MSRPHSTKTILQTRLTNRIRRITFGIIVIVVLTGAGYLIIDAFSANTPHAVKGTIDITASMSGFDHEEIRLKIGEPVTIRLTSVDNQFHSDGGGKHQWAVDELGLNVIAPPKGSKSITFTPDQPGTYTFYCDICCGGRANPTMQGTLIVEA